MLDDGHQAIVVDPGASAPVNEALAARKLDLLGILVTHHHPDHTGGIADLLPRLDGPVASPQGEDIPCSTVALGQGDHIELLGLKFEVLDVPGHTLGHIAFFAADAEPAPLLFCGDTLFSAGCGRLFEGTMHQLKSSLDQLASLPAATRVCCTHEYTLSNLRFAAAVEPGNRRLQEHKRHCEALRAQGLPTLPSTIALELEINPFLRCQQPEVLASARNHGAGSDDPLDVFTALRRWKDRF